MSGTINYETSGGIACLTISQPARLNALHLSMWQAIPDLVARAGADAGARIILLRGAGDKALSAGADISRFATERNGAAAISLYDAAVAAAENALLEVAVPTLALIPGLCFGGGLGLAAACDLRLASAAARFCVPAAKLGIGYAPQGIARLRALIGPAAAAELFFTARIYDASEALRIGLVNQMWETPTFEREAAAYISAIAANAPLSLRSAKLALRELGRADQLRDFTASHAQVARCYDSADYAEGQAAFAQKRAPVFKGL